jgi:hypothetical protein
MHIYSCMYPHHAHIHAHTYHISLGVLNTRLVSPPRIMLPITMVPCMVTRIRTMCRSRYVGHGWWREFTGDRLNHRGRCLCGVRAIYPSVCVCVCMYVCMCICIYIATCGLNHRGRCLCGVYVCMYECVCVCECGCAHTYTYKCTQTQMHSPIHSYGTMICVHTHTGIHTYMHYLPHTHTHTHIHTHKHTQHRGP